METLLVEGRLKKRQGANRRPEECRVFIAGHHVGYIDWATYEENQRMKRRNTVLAVIVLVAAAVFLLIAPYLFRPYGIFILSTWVVMTIAASDDCPVTPTKRWR